MPSLLIVSTDPAATEQIGQLANQPTVRTRSVASIDIAKEWLTKQRFDMILVDSGYEDDIPMSLITLGWQQNPLMIGGIFNLNEKVMDEWYARLLGARVYSGPRALDKIQQTFEFLPSFYSDTAAKAIMFVEDLDSPRNIITSYIEALGYPNVIGVKSAAEALTHLATNPEHYFLVITDINMPKVNGIELIEAIRKDPHLEHLPVTVLTSNPTVQNLVDCLRNGASGFLAKPPRKKELMREIEKAKRIFLTKQQPRICKPEDAHLLEEALRRMGGG